VFSHHERYERQRVPAETEGRRDPPDRYILGIADSFDAMTSERPYRGAWGLKKR